MRKRKKSVVSIPELRRRPAPCRGVVKLVNDFKERLAKHTRACKKCSDLAIKQAAQENLERALYS